MSAYHQNLYIVIACGVLLIAYTILFFYEKEST